MSIQSSANLNKFKGLEAENHKNYSKINECTSYEKENREEKERAEIKARDSLIAKLKEELRDAQEENVTLQKEILNLKTENNHLFRLNQKSFATTNSLLQIKLL